MHLDCTFEACEICQELENLEQEVQTVQETLHKLSQRRIALNNSRNSLHDRLSTKLPVELICQIFVLVDKANNHSSDKRPPVLSKSYFCAPTILSSVCRRWREIALSLPELWTNVYINSRRKPDQVIEDWLKRSGSLPLSLTLYANKDKKPKPLVLDSVCNILRSHSARWQYLDVGFAATNTLHNLFNKLETMPESHSFHLRLGEYPPCNTISLDTPLRPRRFDSKTLLFFDVIPCEWTNLTHLELSRSLIGDVLDIIKAATKLKHCVSRKMCHSNIRKATPVTHHVLEALEISFRNQGTDFFQNITLPSLRQLKYDTNAIPYHEDMFHDLTNFLDRSEIQPTSLQIFSLAYHAFPLPDLDRSGFLELKGVTHLSIDIWRDSKIVAKPKIVEPLLLRMSDPSVFPHLQDLRFKLKGDLHPDPDPAQPDSVGHPSTFLEPDSYSALSNFITEHNAQLQSARDQGMSIPDTVDSILHPQRDPRYTNPTHNGTEVPYRPLLSISVQKSDKVVYMAQLTMTETGPFLQER